jgi:hypothetical protein
MPPPVLAGCDTPLADGAPDMRRIWRVVEVAVGEEIQRDHPSLASLDYIGFIATRERVT